MRISIRIGDSNVVLGLFDYALLIFIICGFYFGGFWVGLVCLGISFLVVLVVAAVLAGDEDILTIIFYTPIFIGVWYMYQLGWLGQYPPLW